MDGWERVEPTTTYPAASSSIAWPLAAVAGCVFCFIIRDTRGVALDDRQRFNFFPASPLCCVSWLFAGDWHLIGTPEDAVDPRRAERLPRLAFSGAQPGPLVSWNPGETFAITLAFYPDALSLMTGLDLSAFTGRMVPAEDALPVWLVEPCRAFHEAVPAVGVARAYTVLEAVIADRWARVRPARSAPVNWLADWSRSLAVRAAFSGSGRSTRQIARRIKSWTGLSERELQGLGHSEHLYAKIYEATQTGKLQWAELATESGFADQAHMIRQLRRHTGFTPEQLRRCAATDEALWAYRLLGQYFDKPSA